MAALPYIQLYVSDYLADTAHLNAAQHGAYMLLIMNYWQRGKPLDNRNERLANVARMSNEEWKQNRESIAEFFNIEGDVWTHSRIEADLDAVTSKSTKNSAAGKASAAAKKANKTTVEQTFNDCSTTVEQTFNQVEADTDTEAEVNRSSVVAGSCEPTPMPPTTFEQPAPTRRGRVCGLLRKAGMADAAPHYLTDEAWEAILCKRSDEEIVEVALAKMAARPGQRTGLKYIAPALLEDPLPITANARDSPPAGRRTIHDEREAVSIALTGRAPKNEHRTIANQEPRDITGESVRVA